ncbi:MAG: polymer-forming cytoskeletal protein [Terracidiphilus sp.]
MWKSVDSETQQPARANTVQPPTPSVAEIPGTPARVASSATMNQYSMIGKSIVIKGEIAASDPLYIYGSVEGSISAPAHRVTIGTEGKVKADISAREVVIMGDVCGNLNGGDRVEIRSDGSLTGDLAARRICIEDGAFLKGAVDVRKPGGKAKPEAQEEPVSALEPSEATPAAEAGSPDLGELSIARA